MFFKGQALKQSWHARIESASTAIKDGTVQEKQDFFNGFVHLLATAYSPAHWCVGWIFFLNETFTRCFWQTMHISCLFSASCGPSDSPQIIQAFAVSFLISCHLVPYHTNFLLKWFLSAKLCLADSPLPAQPCPNLETVP